MNRSVIVNMLGPQTVDFFDNALDKIAQDIQSREIDAKTVYWMMFRIVGLIFPFALGLQAEKEYWRRLAQNKTCEAGAKETWEKAYKETMKSMFTLTDLEKPGFGAISLYITQKIVETLRLGELLTEEELDEMKADHAVERLFAETDAEEVRKRVLGKEGEK